MQEVTDEQIANLSARKGTNTTAQLLVLSMLTDKPLEEVYEIYSEAMDRVSGIYYKTMAANREG